MNVYKVHTSESLVDSSVDSDSQTKVPITIRQAFAQCCLCYGGLQSKGGPSYTLCVKGNQNINNNKPRRMHHWPYICLNILPA